MKIKRKNGFTVVELVIIIAVIAILAAVLIPTFSSIVKKASESTDIQTVRNLNTAIKIDAVHHNSMHDALAAAKANGFAVEQVRSIGSGGDNFVAWDSVNDRFVIIKKGDDGNDKFIFPSPEGEQTGEVTDTDKVAYFVFYDDVPTEQTYSIYLDGKDKTAENVSVSVGFDVGENYGIKNVEYTGTDPDRNIILRTNNTGTDLSVSDTTNSTIAHFGDSGNQTINCGTFSYHEFGGALKATITGGHYVAEGGSIVVVLDASASDGSVTIDLESGSVQGTVKNTNTQNTVTINGKPGAKTISFVANKENNNLKAIFATPPTYTNTMDVGNDGDSLYISGVGTAPRSAYDPEHTEHKYITVSGSLIRICEICGIFEKGNTGSGSEPSEAHTHFWSETPSWSWSGDAENGFTAVATFTCECGSTVSVIAPKGTNNTVVGPTVVNPGCTTDGRTYYTANIYFNGNPYSSDENVVSTTPAHGHSWGEWTVTTPATCEEAGEETRFCSYDGSHKDTRPINPLGHDIVHHEAQAATYNAAGWNAYDTCSRCEYSTYQEIPKLTVGVKFPNTDKYLYRVGNQNPVAVSSLFEGENLTVSVETISGASGEVNGGQITFSGTGVVKVTANNSAQLYLEVVDAINATTATSATNNNVVLLNDVENASSITISNNYAFYGNGFSITFSGIGEYLNGGGMGDGYVKIHNGTLDNVKIICPLFAKAYLYNTSGLEYVTESGNNSRTDGTKKYYAYQCSAVKSSGTSTISNSFISGARNNILAEGELTLDNCVLSNGALSIIHFGSSEGTLSLNDVTTIQYKRTINDFNNNPKIVMGLGIILGPTPDSGVTVSSNPTLNISGYLNQYNWVCEEDGDEITSSKVASRFVNAALSNTNYITEKNGTNYVNVGIIYLNSANRNINENRSNHGYIENNISITGISGAVYAPGANSQTVELKDSSYLYTSNNQGYSMPYLGYSDLETDVKTFVRNSAFDYTFKVKLEAGASYTFDFSKLSATLLGENATYSIKDSSNNVVNEPKILNTAGTNRYTITLTSNYVLDKNGDKISGNEKIYTISLALIAEVADLPEPVKISDPKGTPVKVTASNSTSSDWTMAVAPLDGLIIKYWSTAQNKEVELDFSNVTIESKTTGLDLTIRGNDYTLALASTALNKDTKGQNVWVTASEKLYVTRTTDGRVSSGTGSRETTITYTFTDNCGHTLTNIVKTFTLSKPASGDTLYNHSKLLDGKLTTVFDSGSSGGSCLASGTLITLADGTQVPVETLTGDEMLLVWNLETGKFDSAPIMFIDSDPETEYEVIKLRFSDGTEVKVISEHGFWDYDLNKYVYLDENASQYIGHAFAKQNGAALEKVTLVDVSIETETTTAWSPVTVGHLCYFVDGMLSMPGGISGLFNIFEVDAETMSINADKMQKDIETYGLLTLDDFGGMITEEMFNAFNGRYLGVAVGKGLITWDYISYLAERYSILCE